MENICKNCINYDSQDTDLPFHGQCGKIIEGNPGTANNRIIEGKWSQEATLVGENFGCVHFVASCVAILRTENNHWAIDNIKRGHLPAIGYNHYSVSDSDRVYYKDNLPEKYSITENVDIFRKACLEYLNKK